MLNENICRRSASCWYQMNSFDFMYRDKNLYSICHPKSYCELLMTLPKVGYAFSWTLTISQDCNWHVMCVLLIRACGLLCCWPKYIKPLVRPPFSRLTCRYTNVNMICIPPMGIPNFAKFVVNSWFHRSWSIWKNHVSIILLSESSNTYIMSSILVFNNVEIECILR